MQDPFCFFFIPQYMISGAGGWKLCYSIRQEEGKATSLSRGALTATNDPHGFGQTRTEANLTLFMVWWAYFYTRCFDSTFKYHYWWASTKWLLLPMLSMVKYISDKVALCIRENLSSYKRSAASRFSAQFLQSCSVLPYSSMESGVQSAGYRFRLDLRGLISTKRLIFSKTWCTTYTNSRTEDWKGTATKVTFFWRKEAGFLYKCLWSNAWSRKLPPLLTAFSPFCQILDNTRP